MPRIVREATVAWDGSLSRGSGVAHAGTAAFSLPVDLPSRVAEQASRTSPEELLAAAHATSSRSTVPPALAISPASEVE